MALLPVERLLAENEPAIQAALGQGDLVLKDDAEMRELTLRSRRLLLACQDKQGAIRAAISRIYYSYVNVGMISVYRMMAGLSGEKKWLEKAGQLAEKAAHLIPEN